MCADRKTDATVYYAGSTQYWHRVIVPLTGLQICGSVILIIKIIIYTVRSPGIKSLYHWTTVTLIINDTIYNSAVHSM